MLAPQETHIPTLNRAMRRQQAKDAKRKPPAALKRFSSQTEAMKYLLKPLTLLNDCRPYTPEEIAGDLIRIRACYDRLKDGTADQEDFNRVGVAINLAKLRAMEIDETLADAIERAQDAMNRCKQRWDKHGRFGFDGQGLQDMDYAIEAHETIVEKSTLKQMELCMMALRDILNLQMRKAKPVTFPELIM